MSSDCAKCGTPLPVDSNSDLCWQHGGPALTSESQIRCPFCRELILAEAKKCKHCGEFLRPNSAPPPASPARTHRPTYPVGSKYCTFCGNVGRPRGMDKLELIVVLIISLFTLFIPLMIYLFVRSGERCKKCGKKALARLSSPTARAAVQGVGAVQTITTQSPARNEAARLEAFTPGTREVKRGSDKTMTAAEGHFGYGAGNLFGHILGWFGRNPLWLLALLVVLITTFGVVARMVELEPGPEPEAIVKQRQHMQELAEANRKKDADAFNSLSSQEHFRSAKALLRSTASKRDVEAALHHLDVITADRTEYPASQRLQKSARVALAKAEEAENEQKADSEMRAHPQDLMARVVCKEAVEARLKAPATADFPSFGWNVADLGKWHYSVSSYVDSQNSFGANIRTTFTCDVQCVAENKCVVVGFNSSP
jgi:hypothetical protein